MKKTISLRAALKLLLASREGTPNRKNVAHYIPILETFFLPTINLARDHGYMVPEIRYPKLKTARGRTRVMSDAEIQAVLNELNPDKQLPGWKLSDEARRLRQDAADLWVLFCHTGARFAEISKLEWSQIDLEGRTILEARSITKPAS